LKKKLLSFFLILCFFGCENKVQETNTNSKTKDSIKEVKPDTAKNTLRPLLFTGMYNKSKGSGFFIECESRKKYLVSPEGENAIIDSVYESSVKNQPGKKIYVTAKGFTSVQQSVDKKGFDTVLVITSLMGTDTDVNCEK
jgi:hypothetical protein